MGSIDNLLMNTDGDQEQISDMGSERNQEANNADYIKLLSSYIEGKEISTLGVAGFLDSEMSDSEDELDEEYIDEIDNLSDEALNYELTGLNDSSYDMEFDDMVDYLERKRDRAYSQAIHNSMNSQEDFIDIGRRVTFSSEKANLEGHILSTFDENNYAKFIMHQQP